MRIYGTTKGKNGEIMEGSWIAVKNEEFETIYETVSDENGKYELELPGGHYPFLLAVRDYAVENLEYWCQNINLTEDLELNVRIDSIEIYGLHGFRVKGGFKQLMVYFRPMSLKKQQKGEKDLCPEIKKLCVLVDGQEAKVLLTNRVQEQVEEGTLGAYLVQVDMTGDSYQWNRLDVEIWDDEENFGSATIFED
ncbi:MAG: carboxypeptidase regulatory-like domain-containing protein [Lachnospiraceae bacterium]|nr:carboxypeptidase regulatory-like domain-containing protein [Lachnospiraceae bacterium]